MGNMTEIDKGLLAIAASMAGDTEAATRLANEWFTETDARLSGVAGNE